MTCTQVQPVSRVKIEAVVIATGVNTFFGKAAHLVENTTHVGHFQKVLTSIGNFCICSIAVGIVIEIIVVVSQGRKRRESIDNLLVLLIGGIPIAMPTVLSVTMAIGSHRLSQQWMPLVEFVEQPLIQEDRMFKKIMDICIARLGKRYCRLSAPHLVSKFDGKLSSLYYNIVEDQDFTCQVS